MKIRIQFFSRLRQIGGDLVLEREIDQEATVAGALQNLESEFPELKAWQGRVLLAVGTEFATRDQVLTEGQLLSVMPPVQGG